MLGTALGQHARPGQQVVEVLQHVVDRHGHAQIPVEDVELLGQSGDAERRRGGVDRRADHDGVRPGDGHLRRDVALGDRLPVEVQAVVEIDVDVQRGRLHVDHGLGAQRGADADAVGPHLGAGMVAHLEVHAEAVAQHRRGGGARAVVAVEQLLDHRAVPADQVGAGVGHAVGRCLEPPLRPRRPGTAPPW